MEFLKFLKIWIYFRNQVDNLYITPRNHPESIQTTSKSIAIIFEVFEIFENLDFSLFPNISLSFTYWPQHYDSSMYWIKNNVFASLEFGLLRVLYSPTLAYLLHLGFLVLKI